MASTCTQTCKLEQAIPWAWESGIPCLSHTAVISAFPPSALASRWGVLSGAELSEWLHVPLQFLSGVKQAANEFTDGQQQPHVPGQPAPGTAAGAETPASDLPEQARSGSGSTDWSNLSKLAGLFGSAEEKHGSGFDASTFTSLYALLDSVN